jgi:signal transduction histidine kinase
VDNVVSLVKPTAQHAGIQLRCEQTPNEPFVVRGDSDALKQLLVNLVLNAIEATSRTEPETVAHEKYEHPGRQLAKDVTISLRRDADRLLLEIHDSGKGPAAEVRDTLFDPFVTEKPDGTGLGLWVARETAIAHGGDIRWERREARTVFIVELPALTMHD